MVLISNAYKFLVKNEFFSMLMILFISSGFLAYTGGVNSSISVSEATGLLNTEPIDIKDISKDFTSFPL